MTGRLHPGDRVRDARRPADRRPRGDVRPGGGRGGPRDAGRRCVGRVGVARVGGPGPGDRRCAGCGTVAPRGRERRARGGRRGSARRVVGDLGAGSARSFVALAAAPCSRDRRTRRLPAPRRHHGRVSCRGVGDGRHLHRRRRVRRAVRGRGERRVRRGLREGARARRVRRRRRRGDHLRACRRTAVAARTRPRPSTPSAGIFRDGVEVHDPASPASYPHDGDRHTGETCRPSGCAGPPRSSSWPPPSWRRRRGRPWPAVCCGSTRWRRPRPRTC